MYARITDKTELYLPSSGTLSDGRTVSNYNLLPNDVLLAEGWKPLEEVKPVFDEATQILQFNSAIDNGASIVATYIAVDKPADVYDYILGELGV